MPARSPRSLGERVLGATATLTLLLGPQLGFAQSAFAQPAPDRPAPAVAALPNGAPPAWPLVWHGSTSSPAPFSSESMDLYATCGKADAALVQTAGRSAARQLRGEGPFASDELAFTLRSAGGPHVWPRAWSIEGKDLDPGLVAQKFGEWVNRNAVVGQRRCGIVRTARPDGTTVVSATTIDALADLSPLPTLARVGQWMSLRATTLVPTSEAKVVLLGPRGLPRTVLASLAEGEIRATFSVDQPGPWLVQVLATVGTGPRPVLEAIIYAGTPPPLKFSETPAPGEDAKAAPNDDPALLLAMVNAARHSEGLAPLTRDAAMDGVALTHSQLMRQKRSVGHDVGDGDPGGRMRAGGITYRTSGENVAGASSITRAHRALWASPSHRRNLLENRFSRIGLGVDRDESGRVWVTQLFAD